MVQPIILPAKPIKEKKNYALVAADGKESGVFTGFHPRQAALKAAKVVGGTMDKPTTFKLREKGTNTMHVFKGYVIDIPTPEAQKKFIKSATIKQAYVEKVGIEKVN